MTDLHELDAHDQADLLTRRVVSAVELVSHHLDRADRLGPDLGAFVTLTPDRALRAAHDADRRRAAGEVPIFCGVPTAFKDLTPTAGVRTTMGSALLADAVPDTDAHVVRLVEQAGFVSLGKTNTPEFGLSSYTDNDVVGPAATPWDPSRNAGGSSGGAAAAVAAGLVPLAAGSDGGGSIRIPASCCGVVGFKPSRGRVSPGPAGSDWNGLAGDGPLARTVRDAAALLDVLAVRQVGDARGLPDPPTPFASCVDRDPGRLRIARWSQPYLPGIETDPAVVAVWEDAGRLLAALGHDVVDVPNPFPAELEPQFNVVWSSGMAAAPIPDEAAPMLRANTRYWRERGGRATAAELAAAMQFLDLTTRGVMTGLADFDAFLTPTLAMPPQPHAWFTESGDPAEDHRRELMFTPFTAVYNMAGVPAASLPLGSVDGLPVGVMLATHAGHDAELFSLLGQVEAAAPWAGRRPG
ncbi:Amidase [Aeromicrobium marinum DSM 15272]|uniref:Amidase n=1 Tax=Aeromicrobium marinum DSM 15272 TaxID=585531 RepID=E2SF79_9ACTN|nr:amidase [Aeromicrobium marinum]EFQ82164.1 Amidase [Aeromicrobium marinum DSM 15272]